MAMTASKICKENDVAPDLDETKLHILCKTSIHWLGLEHFIDYYDPT